MRIHFIQHVPFEDPASILDWAEKKKYPVTSGRAYANDPYPGINEFDMLVIMGGPMSVNDEHVLPWLITEKEFVKSSINAGKFVLGICLGAQLIASVLGAIIKPNKHKEIGWFPIKFNEIECERLKLPFKGELMTFHWHGDTFDLPQSSSLLASSHACTNQAFAVGNSVFGFQFHLEANKHSVDRLIFHCENELDGSLYVQNKDEITSRLQYSISTNSVMESFLDWIDEKL
jgi:GMP synthase-like glutamine amidotransferase